jgi:hypothetical protein
MGDPGSGEPLETSYCNRNLSNDIVYLGEIPCIDDGETTDLVSPGTGINFGTEPVPTPKKDSGAPQPTPKVERGGL